eukprot:TRINITY_DN122662_c0_g1_i1.p1 TRINITY_DN122662_c0_g1~~TRINITY_DN122662_c0_g1_i1.p1  ORF type:complete len:410 (-),score=42.48 TRINITY_DN122662_c0_g1_i1:203-1432(-)
MGVSILPLAGIAFKSVATVMACASIGAYARARGVLTKSVEKGLDKLISQVFLPCLILVKVIPNMSPTELMNIWPMGVTCVCLLLYGFGVSALAGRCLARLYPDAFPKYTGLMMVAVAFPNSFSVPMTLMLALGDHPVLLANGQPGGDDLASKIAMLFLMSYAIWILARWSIGFPIMSGAISFAEWRTKVLNPPVVACIVAAVLGLIWRLVPEQFREDQVLLNVIDPFAIALGYAGRCSVPIILLQLGTRLHAASEELFARKDKGTLDPALQAVATGGSAVGKEGSVLDPEIANEAKDGGSACTKPPTEQADVQMPLVAYIVTLVLRQGIGPLVGAGVAGFLQKVCGVESNVALMVGMLQTAGPPMINLGVMAGLSGSAEKETAKLLLLTYSASVVTWTVWIAFFLHVLQ